MNYIEKMQNVSVLGAAGKMGSGILLLTALEMLELKLSAEAKGRSFVLNAIDVSDQALAGLTAYLRAQGLKTAEKNIVRLRSLYSDRADLIDNADIVRQYIDDLLAIVRPCREVAAARHSSLVFEGVNESEELKVKLFREIEAGSDGKTWYLSNTSSIPIRVLAEKAELGGRIIGFHFYNPPPVQKLVEIISADNTEAELKDFAAQYGKRLRKILVPSNDIAGFIGNGHFMRDLLYAISELEKLEKETGFVKGLWALNRVSQDFLIRPMGIFQLMDYVGLDVCQFILGVMQRYLPGEKLSSPLIDEFLRQGIKGGQNADGSQKDGIFKYEKGTPVACWDCQKKGYSDLKESASEVEKLLGALPAEHLAWKKLISRTDKDSLLQSYFAALQKSDSRGARLALAYAAASRETARKLVRDKVAASEADVNTVLLTGFFHAYGPVNNYFQGL